MEINLAIASDRNMEVGLHVTLYSALKSLNPEVFPVFHLFLGGYNSLMVKNIQATLAEFDGRFKIKVYDNNKLDLGAKGFHFNKTCNVIFHVPNIIDADKVLYLDADLLILTDLKEIFDFNLGEKIAGAVSWASIKNTWPKETRVLYQMGIPDQAPYISSGVVLFETEPWRENFMTEKCLEVLRKYYRIIEGDQVVINAILYNKIILLPMKYNQVFWPTNPVLNLESDKDIICHFGGSPKPWDLLGEFLHVSYPSFNYFLKKTYFSDYKSYKKLNFPRLFRTILLLNSYKNTLIKLYKKNKK